MVMFEEYWFLFALAGVVALFAAVQDWKKTEVANWLNFSFITIAIVYRIFYANFSGNWSFFIYGLVGVGFMFVIANLLYYTKVFGGGDAKLLMGFGAVLPYGSFNGVFVLCLVFLMALFFLGAVYSLVYSLVIALRNRKKFSKLFRERLVSYKKINQKWVIALFGALFFIIVIFGEVLGFLLMLFIALFYFGQAYLMSVDNLMIVRRKPNELMEGDWLEKEVKIGRRLIKKSVHGLSKNDIEFLKSKKKSVMVKQGIPFVPVFFVTWGFMVYAFLTLQIPSFLF